MRFEYEEWLLKFAISLSWRCLAASDGSGLNANPQHVAAVEAATGEFAGYLLDQRAAPKPSQSPYAGDQPGEHLPVRDGAIYDAPAAGAITQRRSAISGSCRRARRAGR